MGQGCQAEKSAQLERERGMEFKVYCRDHITHSITSVGRIIERRNRERGNNLGGLLSKAIKDYADCIADPSTIFLLGP